MRVHLFAALGLLFASSTPARADDVPSPEQARAIMSATDEVLLADARRSAREQRNWNLVKPAYAVVQVVHVLDIITTTQCGRPNNGCVEVNAPGLYGREPKLGRVLAVKLPVMILTHFLTREASKKSPAAGFTFLAVSGGLHAKMVYGNIKLLW